jgi:hypothetical protein
MHVDELDEYSRQFYERSLMKRCFSLMFAALVSSKHVICFVVIASLTLDFIKNIPKLNVVNEIVYNILNSITNATPIVLSVL